MGFISYKSVLFDFYDLMCSGGHLTLVILNGLFEYDYFVLCFFKYSN